MKYVTYESGARLRVGVLRGDQIFDADFDGDMVAFISAGAPVGRLTPVEDARLRAPLRPRTLRDFLAFEGHLKNAYRNLGREIPPEWYEVPAYYKGLPDTVIGPEEEIPWPSYSAQLDHELELAVIIGREGRNIPAARVAEYIFGYTIWNDVSARDVQRKELPVGMGPGKAKDWDGSNVLGPCIVTPDEINPSDLRLTIRVQRRGVGVGHHGEHAPHLRIDDRIRVPRPHSAAGRGAWLRYGRRRLGPRTQSMAAARRRDRDGGRGHRRPAQHYWP